MAKSKSNGVVESYLVAYNAASFLGWGYVLVQTVLYLVENGTDLSGLFDRIGYALIYVQTGAALEIVHALLGFVRSGVLTVVMQVYSRLLLVWGTLYLFDTPGVRASYSLVMMVLAWSITECVRYSHYGLSLLGIEVYGLLYLRYTLFYVLYPVGVSGELLEMWAAFPYTGAVHAYYKAFLIYNMLGYPPVLYKLYTHMIRQRRKVLGGAKPEAKETAAATAAQKKKKL
ncbi:hypothetical protein GGI07_000098 [Coemansia sp. Benny D115]|nr:hypothetical protein GGI07_000098 [Coemansia sp. Benny D115]